MLSDNMTGCLFLKGKLKYLILQLLLKQPMHAYAIRTEISKMTENYIKPSFGSIYPALDDLVKDKYLIIKEKDNKKNYIITNSGKKHLNELRNNFKDMEKHIIKSLKNIGFESNPELLMKIFIAHHKITLKLVKEYIQDMNKFLNNYNNKKLKKSDLQKYEIALKKSFECIKEINKNYSD